jgi:hypothetical protein
MLSSFSSFIPSTLKIKPSSPNVVNNDDGGDEDDDDNSKNLKSPQMAPDELGVKRKDKKDKLPNEVLPSHSLSIILYSLFGIARLSLSSVHLPQNRITPSTYNFKWFLREQQALSPVLQILANLLTIHSLPLQLTKMRPLPVTLSPPPQPTATLSLAHHHRAPRLPIPTSLVQFQIVQRYPCVRVLRQSLLSPP